ncbi:hypothetical protein [Arthrobacter sp. 260]|uniref:hypothetical protein n=1 Tax=Arthrobacter sp. 260 TaxID=2735314 RepID=UPI00149151F3|nr:hypothetical protein [Arthrobacter sp. 260]NOJ59769.1 hypothetical protein [Arthrobacter sp. 260]
MDALATVLTAVLTIVSPLAIAYQKKSSWSTLLRTAVPIIVSLVIALAYLWYTGGIVAGEDIIAVILAVYGLQQLAYTTFLRWWAGLLEKHNDPARQADQAAVSEPAEFVNLDADQLRVREDPSRPDL